MKLVTRHKARFIDMIRKVRQGHTREEWNDPMTDDNIQKLIVQGSNVILGENEVNSRVTNAFHSQWYVKDE